MFVQDFDDGGNSIKHAENLHILILAHNLEPKLLHIDFDFIILAYFEFYLVMCPG